MTWVESVADLQEAPERKLPQEGPLKALAIQIDFEILDAGDLYGLR